MKKNRLFLGLLNDDDGASSHFASGAGGRRNRNARRKAVPVIAPIELAELQRRPFEQQSNCLSCIQRASAPEGDHGIAIGTAIRLRAFDNVLFDGVGMNAGEDE